jgi:hypothetical protein
MRRKSPELLALVLASWIGVAPASLAETGTVRLGTYLRDSDGQPLQRLDVISSVLDRLASDMQLFVAGFDGCPDMVAGPLGNGTPRDSLRDTWTVIQTIRVECWALLQFDGNAPVTAFAPDDRITPRMIHGIIAHAERLSAEDEEWAKVLMAFPGGEIACWDGERCRLSLQGRRNPPEQSLDFDLIMATQEVWLIIVTQMVYGRSGFVYGVMWREAAGKGEVASIFPNPP